MEKEISGAAADKYRAIGAGNMKVVMERDATSLSFEYRVIAVARLPTLRRELQAAGLEGFQIAAIPTRANEFVAVLERPSGTTEKRDYVVEEVTENNFDQKMRALAGEGYGFERISGNLYVIASRGASATAAPATPRATAPAGAPPLATPVAAPAGAPPVAPQVATPTPAPPPAKPVATPAAAPPAAAPAAAAAEPTRNLPVIVPDPAAARTALEAGTRAEATKDWKTALQHYQRARALDPSMSVFIDASIARVKEQMGTPSDSDALRRARQYDALGRRAEAITWYERALESLPESDPNRDVVRKRLNELKGAQ